MSKEITIETKGGKLMMMEVPITATEIKTSFLGSGEKYPTLEWSDPARKVPSFYDSHKSCTIIPKGSFIIGTLHLEGNEYVWGFDPEPFVERDREFESCWRNYNDPEIVCEKPQGSFLSLLQSHGLTFVNEYGEKPEEMIEITGVKTGIKAACCMRPLKSGECCGDPVPEPYEEPFQDYDVNPDYIQWSQAEEKRISGKLIILKSE